MSSAYQTILNVTGTTWFRVAAGAALVVVVFCIVKHVSESVAE